MMIWPVCVVHNDRGNPNFNNTICWKATAGDDDYAPCRMVEMVLHPAGSRVVTAEALVIEKVDGEWPTTAKELIHTWYVRLRRYETGAHPASELLDALAQSEVAE